MTEKNYVKEIAIGHLYDVDLTDIKKSKSITLTMPAPIRMLTPKELLQTSELPADSQKEFLCYSSRRNEYFIV